MQCNPRARATIEPFECQRMATGILDVSFPFFPFFFFVSRQALSCCVCRVRRKLYHLVNRSNTLAYKYPAEHNTGAKIPMMHS